LNTILHISSLKVTSMHTYNNWLHYLVSFSMYIDCSWAFLIEDLTLFAPDVG
jgi:hypothetical protein